MRHIGTTARRHEGLWAPQPRGRSHVPTIPRSLAFTLIEVLVVIVIIGVLIAAISVVGVKVLEAQKAKLTETIMQSVREGIEDFKNDDPLAEIYDRKDARTFGAYPPYTLANVGSGVAFLVDPGDPNDLEIRLTHDLAGQNEPAPDLDYVDIHEGNGNDDIRALYAYLAVYTPSALTSVPETARKPLPDRLATDPSEKVNPTGSGTNPPGAGAVDVLGFYDAWGVPLNYFLYVKLEWAMNASGSGVWVVTDRIPVVMSHGHTLEEHQAEVADVDHGLEKWIVSDPFPSPAATVNEADGSLSAPGWARAKAALEDYSYVP